MMDDFISVIVPVYKVEGLLRQCADSLLAQTYRNIEIIFVDDGSPDGCGAICDEYAEKDSRVRVLHTENGGISAARNRGIEAARGDWLMFVDSDDWVAPDYCRIPLEAAKANDADLVLFSYALTNFDGSPLKSMPDFNVGITDKMDAIDLLLFGGMSWGVWNRLFRRDLFREIRFPEGRTHEDAAITHKTILAAERIYVLNDVLYFYRQGREGSITMTEDRANIKALLDAYRQRGEELREIGYPEEKIDHYNVLAAVKYLIHTKKMKDDPDRKWCSDVLRNTNVLNTEHAEALTAKGRMMIRLFRFSPALFDLICHFSGKRTA